MFKLEISEIGGLIEHQARVGNFEYLLGIALFLAFCLIAFASLSRNNLFKSLFVSWWKVQNLKSYLKESLPLNKRGSILLLINYFVSGSILLYLKLLEYEISFSQRILVATIVPFAVFGFGMFSLSFAGIVTGEGSRLQEPQYMRVIGAEVSGLLFFLGALVWMLNIQLVDYIWIAAVAVFIGEFVFRLLKSVAVVFSNGVSWFYIILYLCTLEILPLFVAYYLVMKNFSFL